MHAGRQVTRALVIVWKEVFGGVGVSGYFGSIALRSMGNWCMFIDGDEERLKVLRRGWHELVRFRCRMIEKVDRIRD